MHSIKSIDYQDLYLCTQMNEDHYRKLEKMYLHANINEQLFQSTECNIALEKASVSLQIDEKYFHALGAIHGAIYFKLLDDSSYFAAHSVVEDYFLLTTSFNMNILRPANKGRIVAKGEIKFKSRNLLVAESTIYNEAGKVIAFGTGNFAKSKILLKDCEGYTLDIV